MRITLVTEAWTPQVNGVVTTWSRVTSLLRAAGDEVEILHPELFRTIPCPGYPSIPIAIAPGGATARRLDEYRPDALHIATEGPLGSAARRHALRRGWPFTTSYHTQFPEYLKAYIRLPEGISYRYMRRFHRPATHTLVPTPSIAERLTARGMTGLVLWTRGVDRDRFHPGDKSILDAPRPIYLCAGRVAREKNLVAFLDAKLDGTKIIMGDGPELPSLRARYPKVRFLGYRPDLEFSRFMAAADVFVFPSRTDTFGLVMIEAMACGVPVAAYPVTGPIDVVKPGVSGALHEDLATACRAALEVPPDDCIAYSSQFTWERCAEIVRQSLAPIEHPA